MQDSLYEIALKSRMLAVAEATVRVEGAMDMKTAEMLIEQEIRAMDSASKEDEMFIEPATFPFLELPREVRDEVSSKRET